MYVCMYVCILCGRVLTLVKKILLIATNWPRELVPPPSPIVSRVVDHIEANFQRLPRAGGWQIKDDVPPLTARYVHTKRYSSTCTQFLRKMEGVKICLEKNAGVRSVALQSVGQLGDDELGLQLQLCACSGCMVQGRSFTRRDEGERSELCRPNPLAVPGVVCSKTH